MTAFRIALTLIAALTCVQSGAVAQTFPDKFVKIIINVPAGGVQDQLARSLASELTTIWKQPVVVESRPGAGGTLAIEAVRQSRADGYTLLQMDSANIFTNAFLREKKPPYDFDKVMIPVRSIVGINGIFVTSPTLPVNSVQEFIALAKASPGKFTYGSFGPGSAPHIETEAFAEMVGIKLTHVPYRGGGPLVQALTSGEVSMAMPGLTSSLAQVIEGKLKGLAYLASERSPLLPNIPTMREAGVPFDLTPVTIGLWAPEGTPAALVDKLSADVGAALNTAAFKKSIEPFGHEFLNEPGPMFHKRLAAHAKLFEARAAPLGIKLSD